MEPFTLKLILSFIVGAIWVTGATILAEKYGTKLGGVIVGFPSTVIVGLFFIAWTQSTMFAKEATTILPIGDAVICLFVLTFCALVMVNFWLALVAGIGVWGLLAAGLVKIQFDNFTISVLAYILVFLIVYYLLEKKLHIPSQSKKKVHYTFSTISFRALLSGSVISLAVIMAKIGGPLLGGMFTVFPASMISSIIIIYLAQGKLFAAAVLKTSMIASISVVVYGIAVRYAYVPLGLVWGTVVSILIAFVSVYLIHKRIMPRVS